MAAVLFSNAPLGGRSPSDSDPQSGSQPQPQPHKSFKQMVRASLQETLRTATRSKPKPAAPSTTSTQGRLSIDNDTESRFASGLGISTTKLVKASAKGKEREQLPRRSTDTSASDGTAALRKPPSRTTFGFGRKSIDSQRPGGTSPEPPLNSTVKKSGWTSFIHPSQSAGSISTPVLHLHSDPQEKDTQESQMVTSGSSVGVIISPPRARRPSRSSAAAPPALTRRDSSNQRRIPSPTTLVLASSSKNVNGTTSYHSKRGTLSSPSTPTLPSYPNGDSTIYQTPTRTRAPLRAKSPPERSLSRSRSDSPDSRSPSPSTSRGPSRSALASSPSPPPRRSSDRRPSFEAGRPSPSPARKMYGSLSQSTSNLPAGAALPHRSVPAPIQTGQPPSSAPGLYQRRNSSTASFGKPSSPIPIRATSPVYRAHGRNASTTSLHGAGSSLMTSQREAMRAAASFILREMAKPLPAVFKAVAAISPYGGLAGAPSNVKVDPWEEIEQRLRLLTKAERVWGMPRMGSSPPMERSLSGSSVTVNVIPSAGGSEEKERRMFCDALRDGYVLAQLMNKLNPTSPLPIPRVDPREDGISRTSNILKFREAAKEFIAKSGSSDVRDVPMFLTSDMSDGTIDSIARVSRVISALAAEGSGSTRDREKDRERWIPGGGRNSSEVERSPTNARFPTPTSPDRASPEFSSDSQGSGGKVASKLGPAPSSPPPVPPTKRRPSVRTERRTSGGGIKVSPDSPPPVTPRSLLRTAPSFGSNRASVASSAQTHQTELFDPPGNARHSGASNRFGTMRTLNTAVTDATSIRGDNSNSGSWGREDAQLALGLADQLEARSSSPRRKSYELKAIPSGLGLALQSHPPVTPVDARPPRRDRRSSEIAADLARVTEETVTDMEGSIRLRERSVTGLRNDKPSAPNGLKVGKGQWPEDFQKLPGRRPSMQGGRQPLVSSPLTDELLASALTSDESSSSERRKRARLILAAQEDLTPKGKDNDKTPRAKLTAPMTIITTASNDNTPEQEKDERSALSLSQSATSFKRPTHKAGSQSVDVLLPRSHTTRQVSAERSKQLPSPHERDSSGGSNDSAPLEDSGIRRPLRRPSLKNSNSGNGPRQAVYIPKRSATGVEDLGRSSSLSTRVPFPRTSSGEQPTPLSPRAADYGQTSESTIRDSLMMPPPPVPAKDPVSPTRPTLRGRYQSELDTPSMTRRGSSNNSPSMNRRGSAGAGSQDIPLFRSRFESMQNMSSGMGSSTNLTRVSSIASGSQIRKSVVVREEGKAPMHYQLGNCIGKGQFGAVYRALNLNTGQMVAVKRISLAGLSEREVTQLMKEVEILKTLQHTSIVSYEGMVRDEDSLDIVLEYVENGSLGQTLKSFGKFNERLVASYVIKILEGLHYLHEQKVVHCDLKAANILSTKNGNIKLSDFGVSLATNAMENAMDTADNNVAGTPNWMAPEVIELKGATTASDIWSLGCTVVELLTGKPPYSELGNSLSVMFRIVEDENAPIPEGCSPDLHDFLSLCFKKNPGERPSAETLFEHKWLKRTWGLNKDLRPEDSVPFLRRVSTDLQARQLSIQNLGDLREVPQPPQSPPADQPEFEAKPHTFIKATFGEHITCKVCLTYVKKSAVLCEECGLICHAHCARDASAICDFRAQRAMYALYAQGKGSPRLAGTGGALPSPVLPGSYPYVNEMPLSSSPSFHNKIFPWKRHSKTSTPEAGLSTPAVNVNEERVGSQRRSGGGFPGFARRSEDRSRTRRDSMFGGSQQSTSTRSGATNPSASSNSRRRLESTVTIPRVSTTALPLSPTPALPSPSTLQVPSGPAPPRRRTRKDSSAQSKSDCTIQ